MRASEHRFIAALGLLLCGWTGACAQIGGATYADSADFTLNTTGILPVAGGAAYADSASFILDTRTLVPIPTFTTLHNFTGSDGAYPQGGLVLSGNTLFGTTAYGGSAGNGTVFALGTDGTGFTNLHHFTDIHPGTNSDGTTPYAGLALSGDTLYGTASQGGPVGLGTVFSVKTDGSVFSVLYTFTNRYFTYGFGGVQAGDAPLTVSAGSLYWLGRDFIPATGNGALFKGDIAGAAFTVLYTNFSLATPPTAGLVLWGDTLYGTTLQDGDSGYGSVFAIATDGTGFRNLYSFSSLSNTGGAGTNAHGAYPSAGLALSGSMLYGTTTSGGPGGRGTVFACSTDGAVFNTLYSFTAIPVGGYSNSDGALPQSGGLIVSGNTLYGTASEGGSAGDGTLFAVNTDGSGFTNLHSFTTTYDANGNHYSPISGTNADGSFPLGRLVLSGTTLYGTTPHGGVFGNGTVFAFGYPLGVPGCPGITLNPLPTTTFILYRNYHQPVPATGGVPPYSCILVDGALPEGLAFSADGVLVGTPTSAGSFTFTLAEADANGCAGTNTYSLIVTSCPSITLEALNTTTTPLGGSYFGLISAYGGVEPYSYAVTGGSLPGGLSLAGEGGLSGVPSTAGTFTFTVTATDANGCTGTNSYTLLVTPCPAVALEALSVSTLINGRYYYLPVTASGGVDPYTYAVMAGSLPDGMGFGIDGALYGTPTNDGSYSFSVIAADIDGCPGTNSYSLTVLSCPAITLEGLGSTNLTTGTSYSQTIAAGGGAAPYAFAVTSGALPCGLTLSSDGVLSGAPVDLGGFSFTVTATDTNGCAGTNAYSIVINQGAFTYAAFAGANGAYPDAELALIGSTLYGTASGGGSAGYGTVFAINTDGTGLSALYSFSALSSGANADGAFPSGGLVLSGTTLYGTAGGGGSAGNGTVFAIHTDGTGFTNLYNFTPLDPNSYTNSDGAYPYGRLVLSGTTLYGTASEGGAAGNGTVFALQTDGTGFTAIHTFTPLDAATSTTNADGDYPYGELLLSSNTLYGTAAGGGSGGEGTVFALQTDGSGFTTLYSFTPLDPATSITNRDGANPYGGLALSGSTLYGTAAYGGNWGNGTVFSIQTNGSGFASLHHFTADGPPDYTNSDGAIPEASLVLSGNTLYGTALEGGGWEIGTIFKLNTDGTGFTTLHHFAGCEGAYPAAGLLLSANTLYGTAFQGGSVGGGTVFSLTLAVSAPPLNLTLTGGNVILTWDANAYGFTLQSTTDLAPPANWTPVTPAPEVVNGLNTVTNPISGSQQFYRLSQ